VRKPIEQASLDHAMWLHRPFRDDEWLLYAQAVPSLAASVTQEGLSRLTR
jgi:acyl-CoA thioesterase-2